MKYNSESATGNIPRQNGAPPGTQQGSAPQNNGQLFNEYNDNQFRDPKAQTGQQRAARNSSQTSEFPRPDTQTVGRIRNDGRGQNPRQAPAQQNRPQQNPQNRNVRNGGQQFGYNPYAGGERNGQTARPNGTQNGARNQNAQNGREPRYVTPGSGGTDIRLRKSTRKTDRNRVIIIAIIAVLLVTVIIIGVSAMNYKPFGGIDVPWIIQDGSDNYVETTTDDGRPKRITGSVIPGTYTRTSSSKYNFLVVGKDHVATNTDVIWLVSFDVDSGQAAVMQIPRDTLIRYSGSPTRLNTMYSRHHSETRKSGVSNDSEDWIIGGMDGVAADIERILCVNIDYWVLVNLEGFSQVVDALGGVTIDVPYDLDYEDPYQELYIHIKQGEQTMDGVMAQGFMRFRSGYVQGDIGRVNAQKIMITALLKTFREKFNIFMISDLIKAVFPNVKTNMQFADVSYLAKKALGVDLDSMVMMTMPGEATQLPSGAWRYVMKRADTLYLINRYFNVFDQPVSDSDFDRGELFNYSSNKILGIYRSPQSDDPVAEYVRTGQSVDENSVRIDLVPETTAEDDLSSTSGPDGADDE